MVFLHNKEESFLYYTTTLRWTMLLITTANHQQTFHLPSCRRNSFLPLPSPSAGGDVANKTINSTLLGNGGNTNIANFTPDHCRPCTQPGFSPWIFQRGGLEEAKFNLLVNDADENRADSPTLSWTNLREWSLCPGSSCVFRFKCRR